VPGILARHSEDHFAQVLNHCKEQDSNLIFLVYIRFITKIMYLLVPVFRNGNTVEVRKF
jgi:hypothetical protein